MVGVTIFGFEFKCKFRVSVCNINGPDMIIEIKLKRMSDHHIQKHVDSGWRQRKVTQCLHCLETIGAVLNTVEMVFVLFNPLHNKRQHAAALRSESFRFMEKFQILSILK